MSSGACVRDVPGCGGGASSSLSRRRAFSLSGPWRVSACPVDFHFVAVGKRSSRLVHTQEIAGSSPARATRTRARRGLRATSLLDFPGWRWLAGVFGPRFDPCCDLLLRPSRADSACYPEGCSSRSMVLSACGCPVWSCRAGLLPGKHAVGELDRPIDALNILPRALTAWARTCAGAMCAGAFLASGAVAGTFCTWGAHADRDTRAEIMPHDEAFAEIVIDNNLTGQRRAVCALTLFGVTIEVEYVQRSGTLPDDFIITVPPGFRAVPAEITIDDFDRDSVLIWLDGGVGS